MGGTTNATDNFAVAASAGDASSESAQAAVAEVQQVQAEQVAEGHVHGPNCGHDHSHEEVAQEPPKGRYLTPDMIPELNLVASFDLNNSGPIWRKTPQELLTNIAFQAANVPEGGAKVCFVNNEAYKFLLALAGFRKKFQPASADRQKKGIVGLFDTHVIIVCDALWEQGEQLTLHKAIYFCDEVVVPTTELLIETAVTETAAPAEEAHAHAHHGHHGHGHHHAG